MAQGLALLANCNVVNCNLMNCNVSKTSNVYHINILYIHIIVFEGMRWESCLPSLLNWDVCHTRPSPNKWIMRRGGGGRGGGFDRSRVTNITSSHTTSCRVQLSATTFTTDRVPLFASIWPEQGEPSMENNNEQSAAQKR